MARPSRSLSSAFITLRTCLGARQQRKEPRRPQALSSRGPWPYAPLRRRAGRKTAQGKGGRGVRQSQHNRQTHPPGRAAP